MSKQVTIRDDLYALWKNNKDADGKTELSFSDWIDSILQNMVLQEATITQEGRITKTLAGKTILYRIKQEPSNQAISNTTTAAAAEETK